MEEKDDELKKERVNGICFKFLDILDREIESGVTAAEMISAQLLNLKTTMDHLSGGIEPPIELKMLMLSADLVLNSIGKEYGIEFELKRFPRSEVSH